MKNVQSSYKCHWCCNWCRLMLTDVSISQSASRSLVRSNSPPKMGCFDWFIAKQYPDAILALRSVFWLSVLLLSLTDCMINVRISACECWNRVFVWLWDGLMQHNIIGKYSQINARLNVKVIRHQFASCISSLYLKITDVLRKPFI